MSSLDMATALGIVSLALGVIGVYLTMLGNSAIEELRKHIRQLLERAHR